MCRFYGFKLLDLRILCALVIEELAQYKTKTLGQG